MNLSYTHWVHLFPHKYSSAGYTCTHTSTQVLGTPVPTQVLMCWVHLWPLKCWVHLYPHKYSRAGYTCDHTSTHVLGTPVHTQASSAGYTCDHTSTQVLGTPVTTQVLKCWVHLWPHKYSSAGYTCDHTSTQVQGTPVPTQVLKCFIFSLLWVNSHSHACHPACVQICTLLWSSHLYHLIGLVVKASASRAEDPGSESRLHQDFFRVKSYQWLKNWHSSGYPVRRLAL